jgi:transcriptional regulator with XRE-family HTH domain
MAGKEPKVGATSRAVAANVQRLREAQNMNYTDVSERLAPLWSINAVGIRRIENGERRVTPDDLVALAVVLGVSPATLLMPEGATKPNDLVEVTGWHKPVPAGHVWRWLTAKTPFVKGFPSFMAFVDRSWPSWEQEQWLEKNRVDRMDSADGND